MLQLLTPCRPNAYYWPFNQELVTTLGGCGKEAKYGSFMLFSVWNFTFFIIHLMRESLCLSPSIHILGQLHYWQWLLDFMCMLVFLIPKMIPLIIHLCMQAIVKQDSSIYECSSIQCKSTRSLWPMMPHWMFRVSFKSI